MERWWGEAIQRWADNRISLCKTCKTVSVWLLLSSSELFLQTQHQIKESRGEKEKGGQVSIGDCLSMCSISEIMKTLSQFPPQQKSGHFTKAGRGQSVCSFSLPLGERALLFRGKAWGSLVKGNPVVTCQLSLLISDLVQSGIWLLWGISTLRSNARLKCLGAGLPWKTLVQSPALQGWFLGSQWGPTSLSAFPAVTASITLFLNYLLICLCLPID